MDAPRELKLRDLIEDWTLENLDWIEVRWGRVIPAWLMARRKAFWPWNRKEHCVGKIRHDRVELGKYLTDSVFLFTRVVTLYPNSPTFFEDLKSGLEALR